ncbi:MAG TPA: calcium/sodium antiporter [Nitriliruptoraceae bacterium]|nr:calcium/sodium antiporter [Nitriliruptoraceae bacterium]
MAMLLPALGLLVGLAILTFAAELFVVGAVRTAARLQMSPVVIGAVVIGIGTSAPEIVVSGFAAAGGNLEIAVGNIVGSNLANVSLVLGAAALVATLTVQSSTLRREAPLSIVSVLLFAVLVQGGLTRLEGVVLMVALVATVTWLVVSARREGNDTLEGEVEEFVGEEEVRLGWELGRALVGLVGTVGAAQLLVTSALSIASTLGLGEGFVGLTIVAVGTSLPELATSLQATRKDETDLVIGNLLGSNIFNSLAVGGVAALLGPGIIDDVSLTVTAVLLMVAVVLVAGLFMLTGRRVSRREGVILLVAWMAMIPLTV